MNKDNKSNWYIEEIGKIIKKLKKSLISTKIRSRKNKGLNLQKWICSKISELINISYDQQNDQCLIHSREAGQSGTDIILRGEALKLFPFSIECKSSEGLNVKTAIDQAKNNQIDKTYWMLIYKRKSFKKPIVIIDWFTFEKLWKKEI